MLKAIVELYAAFAEDHQQDLTSDIADGVSVRGDRELLTQMLVNLVENALRHSPGGTKIDVRLERVAGSANCVVADNGPGIPAEEHDKLFPRLSPLHPSRPPPRSRLGLTRAPALPH